MMCKIIVQLNKKQDITHLTCIFINFSENYEQTTNNNNKTFLTFPKQTHSSFQ